MHLTIVRHTAKPSTHSPGPTMTWFVRLIRTVYVQRMTWPS